MKEVGCFTLPKISVNTSAALTFATLALQNGVDVKTVSAMLGHSSAGFTLATYTHSTTAAQHQAAAIMGNLVSGKKPE